MLSRGASAGRNNIQIFQRAAGVEENHRLARLVERGLIQSRDSVVLFNTGGALKYLDVVPS